MYLQKKNKLATLKSFILLNMQLLREEHDEALNAAKDHGTTETIEFRDKLRQTLEDKIGDVMRIGEEQDMLMRKT